MDNQQTNKDLVYSTWKSAQCYIVVWMGKEFGPALIPSSGRSPGEGDGNPLQYSCLRIPWMEKPGRLQSTGWQRV